jgi:alpha-amylase
MPRILFWLNYRRNHVGQGTIAVPSPFDGDATVPYWYDKIAAMAAHLAALGCTDVLFPNPVMNVGGQYPNQDGYGPYDDYDLGSKGHPTRFGTVDQLRRAIAVFHANGIQVHLDIVNHQRAGGSAGFYRYGSSSGRGLGRFPKEPSYFRGAPPRVPQDPVPDPPDDFAFGDEFCPVNALPKAADGKSVLWHELHHAGDWEFRTTGADGCRLDDMKGTNLGFVNSWMNSAAMAGKFMFAEYASGNSNDLNWWCGQVNERASTIDFDFHYNMAQEACMNPSFYMGSLAGRGQLSSNPMKAMPFVESMDSDTNGFATIVNNKLLGYAMLLTMEGFPMVYIRDFLSEPDCYGLHVSISNLCWIHQVLANGPTVTRFQSNHIYAYERTGKPGLLVALNNDFFNPGWHTITVPTSFGSNVQLHDFTGRNGEDCWTDGFGRATFGVPPAANGHGYGCWAPAEYQGWQVEKPHARMTVQEFEGAADLDIAPLSTSPLKVGRVWCDKGTPLTVQWLSHNGGAADYNVMTDIMDPALKLAGTTRDLHFTFNTQERGWHHIVGSLTGATATMRTPFRCRVTYMAPRVLAPSDF